MLTLAFFVIYYIIIWYILNKIPYNSYFNVGKYSENFNIIDLKMVNKLVVLI